MAGEHEVVGSKAWVPERVFGGDDANVVGDEAAKREGVVGDGLVEEGDHHCDGEGHEVDMGCGRVHGAEPGSTQLELVDEPALGGVDILARTVVYQRRLPFLVHKQLESFLHFHVTPTP